MIDNKKGFAGLESIADSLENEKENNINNNKNKSISEVNHKINCVSSPKKVSNADGRNARSTSNNSNAENKVVIGLLAIFGMIILLSNVYTGNKSSKLVTSRTAKTEKKIASTQIPSSGMVLKENRFSELMKKRTPANEGNKPSRPTNVYSEHNMYITGSEVRMRDAASLNSTPIDKFELGEKVILLGRSGQWCRVQRANGDIGYVYSDYCKETLTTQRVAETYISGVGVRARSGPGTRNPIIGEFEDGEAVKIINRSGEWDKVRRDGGQVCWVYAKYLETD